MSGSSSQQTDLFQGGEPGVAPVGAAPPREDHRRLAATLPSGLRLGTSSWTFPGWAGIVYDRTVPQATLVRHGLEAYGRHPLFRTVGVDRTYYRPLPTGTLQEYVDVVPPGFRFLLKGPRETVFPSLGPSGGRESHNPSFLDPAWATDVFVGPVLDTLRAAAGPLVFQFPPLPTPSVQEPGRFAERLHRFLTRLPRSGQYAVELRNPELLTSSYAEALRSAGAVHCLNVHPSMPSLEAQHAWLDPDVRTPLVVRWMLSHGQRYEAARDRYHPFDRLVDEDPVGRAAIGRASLEAAARGADAWVIVNNKAEGSSPLSVFRLAAWIVENLGGV